MPKESVIRKKVIDKLSEDGWITWFPHKARYAKEVDIFGVFDVIAIGPADSILLLIQLTDYTNVSHRVKKVNDGFATNHIEPLEFSEVNFEVWGWNPKKKEFRIVTP